MTVLDELKKSNDYSEHHTSDKSSWDEGVWIDEPDAIFWVDKSTWYNCSIIRNQFGALCGYVAVSRNNIYYNDTDTPDSFEVHGGITFNAIGFHDVTDYFPEYIRFRDLRIYGFDCAHGFDLCPGMVKVNRSLGLLPRGAELYSSLVLYKDVAFVINQVQNLAKQLRSGEIKPVPLGCYKKSKRKLDL